MFFSEPLGSRVGIGWRVREHEKARDANDEGHDTVDDEKPPVQVKY